ncbi:Protein Hikeshi [Dirofilaria immitis]
MSGFFFRKNNIPMLSQSSIFASSTGSIVLQNSQVRADGDLIPNAKRAKVFPSNLSSFLYIHPYIPLLLIRRYSLLISYFNAYEKMNERSPQTIGSVIEYMCMVAYRKFITRARGETIRKRLLNKKFLFDVSDKENMQRLEGGLLGAVEAYELKGFVQDLRKRGIAHDGPDGIHIPALETMGEPAEEVDASSSSNVSVSEADAILKDAAARAAASRRIGSSNKVQRTSPSKLRAYFEITDATLTEVPIPNEKEDMHIPPEGIIIKKVMDDDSTNDENQRTIEEESLPKRARHC